MQVRKQNAWTIGAALLLIAPYLFRALQLLGDVDTACQIAGQSQAECGSSAVIDFILSPPVWLVSLSVAAALFAFWKAERQKEKIPNTKLDKLHGDFWARDAEFTAAKDKMAEKDQAYIERTEAAESAATAVAEKLQELIDRCVALENRFAEWENKRDMMLGEMEKTYRQEMQDRLRIPAEMFEQSFPELQKEIQRLSRENETTRVRFEEISLAEARARQPQPDTGEERPR